MLAWPMTTRPGRAHLTGKEPQGSHQTHPGSGAFYKTRARIPHRCLCHQTKRRGLALDAKQLKGHDNPVSSQPPTGPWVLSIGCAGHSGNSWSHRNGTFT